LIPIGLRTHGKTEFGGLGYYRHSTRFSLPAKPQRPFAAFL
jgi:hypothetical protein